MSRSFCKRSVQKSPNPLPPRLCSHPMLNEKGTLHSSVARSSNGSGFLPQLSRHRRTYSSRRCREHSGSGCSADSTPLLGSSPRNNAGSKLEIGSMVEARRRLNSYSPEVYNKYPGHNTNYGGGLAWSSNSMDT